MTQQERDQLAVKIAECAYFYGKTDLDREKISMFINVISKFYSNPFSEIIKAFDLYMHDSKNRFFPNPSQLREYLEKKVDAKLEADSLARKIDKAILTYGQSWGEGYFDGFYENDRSKPKLYYIGKDRKKHATFKEAIISEVGEIGFGIIERRGGWKQFCISGQNNYDNNFFSRLRDSCEYEIRTDAFNSINENQLDYEEQEKIEVKNA